MTPQPGGSEAEVAEIADDAQEEAPLNSLKVDLEDTEPAEKKVIVQRPGRDSRRESKGKPVFYGSSYTSPSSYEYKEPRRSAFQEWKAQARSLRSPRSSEKTRTMDFKPDTSEKPLPPMSAIPGYELLELREVTPMPRAVPVGSDVGLAMMTTEVRTHGLASRNLSPAALSPRQVHVSERAPTVTYTRDHSPVLLSERTSPRVRVHSVRGSPTGDGSRGLSSLSPTRVLHSNNANVSYEQGVSPITYVQHANMSSSTTKAASVGVASYRESPMMSAAAFGSSGNQYYQTSSNVARSPIHNSVPENGQFYSFYGRA